MVFLAFASFGAIVLGIVTLFKKVITKTLAVLLPNKLKRKMKEIELTQENKIIVKKIIEAN
jgi:hypothetical protein